MMMEMMGLHLPGSAFVNPNTPLRDALVAAAPKRAIEIRDGTNDYTPMSAVVDAKSLVNALAGLLATGGSTNHTLHLIAMARAAGVHDHLGRLRRPQPRHAADRQGLPERDRGRERLPCGRRHGLRDPPAAGRGPGPRRRADRGGPGLRRYQTEPFLDGGKLVWREGTRVSLNRDILRPVDDPFQPRAACAC
jgi:phosphogluconate dehydratase